MYKLYTDNMKRKLNLKKLLIIYVKLSTSVSRISLENSEAQKDSEGFSF